jgi:hypothetical protein
MLFQKALQAVSCHNTFPTAVSIRFKFTHIVIWLTLSKALEKFSSPVGYGLTLNIQKIESSN